ncbi:MAG: AAC(3) family N-acetyltransferase [Thiomicrospira sp.]|uniref:AAC(3) family N-acetyltransferase n=1 Tax=Thiomicrospira sp. TaxID=935 RepID=UPI001A042AEA|nr:AAC(3) family N-acetyltransferase [Thiomicrospira sp.]MBE0494495.1 AAC(3) family N-acetyltransferase [Thiomicrospira sp.]
MNSEDLKDKIRFQLTELGLQVGDTLLVRADLGSIGKLSRNRLDYIDVILGVLGESGTLVGLAFTGATFIRKDKKNIFDGSNKANTGAFANVMLSHPKAKRSRHPTNSYVAIGKNADFILDDHDENSGAYEPIRKIKQLNGKMALMGCVSTSPGFTTTHLAEVDLGLHRRIIFPTLNTCYYKKEQAKLDLFKRTDIGGCSSTFFKFYAHYVREQILQQGYVGNAYSVLVDSNKAYDIDYKILKDNPKYNICENPDCFLCRARRWDNLQDAPAFFIRKMYRKFVSTKS